MQVDLDYTEDVKRAIQIAQSIAREYSNSNFSPAHLLRAILHKDVGLVTWLKERNIDNYFLEDWADVRIETYPKSTKASADPSGDDKIIDVFEEADNLRIKMSKEAIDPLCLLASLSTPGIAFSFDQLKTFPVTQNEVLNDVIERNTLSGAISAGSNGKGLNGSSPNKADAVNKYCIDKTLQAREGKLDAVVARDKEIRMVIEILGRRSKPNVIITGEGGVGKTALVNGFVQEIVNNKVPVNLKSSMVFELDFGSLIAGASYKGEIEDRLKNIMRDIKQFDKAILFIDNIHSLLDKNGNASGASSVLKPELSKGEITIIGATNNDDYRKHIETDEAFSRLFERVKIEEPDETSSARMLKLVVPYYETHHKLKVSEDVIPETIRLARRYLKERSLPDAAIDLIDRTMAVVRLMGETSQDDLVELRTQLDELSKLSSTLPREELLREYRWFFSQMKNKINPVLFSQIIDEQDVNKIDSDDSLLKYIREVLEALQKASENKKESIEKTDVAAVISRKTGIPLGKLQSQERERLMNMEVLLKNRVVGQDHAIKGVCDAILESRSGLSKPGQPIGSFFFLGPTGTGKTELAKSLAEFLFNDESAMIRFDMSEFKEEHSAALLYGAPPGYVGYEEGGMLVNKIRQNPYAIVLFDEIEKAHPSVFDLFLQIMDEGKLHDRLGKEGDFSNSVVLFTSNVGSDFIVQSFDKGEIPKSNDLMEIMARHFRPEFLGRLTEIIPFSPITEQIVLNIFEIQLKGFLKILNKQDIQLNITQKAKEYLAKSGFTPKYGARPVASVIRNQIRRPLSKKIIAGELIRGDTINLDIDNNNALLWSK